MVLRANQRSLQLAIVIRQSNPSNVRFYQRVERLRETENALISLSEDISAPERREIIIAILYGLITRLICNKQGVYEHRRLSAEATEVLHESGGYKASGIYPTAALLNHSCQPNMFMVSARC